MLADSAPSWTAVALALIAALPGIIAAIAALSVRRSVQTPSGPSIGQQVEDAHHVAIANNHALNRPGIERRLTVRKAPLPAEPSEVPKP